MRLQTAASTGNGNEMPHHCCSLRLTLSISTAGKLICAAAMRPFAGLLWTLVCVATGKVSPVGIDLGVMWAAAGDAQRTGRGAQVAADTANPAKTDEPIEMSFGGQTRVQWRNYNFWAPRQTFAASPPLNL